MNKVYERITAKEEDISRRLREWRPEKMDLQRIPQGDVPGERVEIREAQIGRAETLFREMIKTLPAVISKNPYQRVVLAVCGGSGVGKTSIAALLACFFRQAQIGCYVLSGDNYPHRFPKYNDAERLHIYRECGLQGMIRDGVYTPGNFAKLQQWQQAGEDADPAHLKDAGWFRSYADAGRKGLEGYLGTEKEIAFCEVGDIITAFKDGAVKIWLKRMGRQETELWYEEVDFKDIQVLLIEWTHGNSDSLTGVDFSVLLNSTPQETMAYRKARNRDGASDSPFTTMVLEIEQGQLMKQAGKAKLIMSKSGGLLTYEELCRSQGERQV